MKNRFVPYNQKLVPLARKLRNKSTLSEVLLWNKLKNKPLLGYNFDRQKPLGNCIVDFYCSELMLAVEIYGCGHHQKSKNDLSRQQLIERFGIRVLRFLDIEIKSDIEGVLEIIRWHIQELEVQQEL